MELLYFSLIAWLWTLQDMFPEILEFHAKCLEMSELMVLLKLYWFNIRWVFYRWSRDERISSQFSRNLRKVSRTTWWTGRRTCCTKTLTSASAPSPWSSHPRRSKGPCASSSSLRRRSGTSWGWNIWLKRKSLFSQLSRFVKLKHLINLKISQKIQFITVSSSMM